MRMVKYLIGAILFMASFPLVTKAECGYERTAELAKMAGNVQFSYGYEKVESGVRFSIYMTNLIKDLYVVERNSEKVIYANEYVFMGNSSGSEVAYDIYSNDANCKGELITTKYVNLPYYNYYSDSYLCGEQPEFKYCQKWMNTADLTEGQFIDKLNKYEEENFSKGNKKGNNGSKSFFEQNYILIIITIIGFIALPFLIILKRRVMA